MENLSRFTSYFGLTGGIACGKSTVAQYLAACGARVVDADRLGHEMLLPGSPAYAELLAHFGPGILAEDNCPQAAVSVPPGGQPLGEADRGIDRRKLGAIVFANPTELKALNAIVHPRIIRLVEEQAAKIVAGDADAVVVVDAALIYEAGIAGRCRKVIVAWCRAEQQLARLMTKSGLPRAQAEARIAAQMPLEEKRRRADFAIDCSGTLQQTRSQAEALFEALRRLAREEAGLVSDGGPGVAPQPSPGRVKL